MLAIIGGSGLAQFPELEIESQQQISTPYGEPSEQVTRARLGQQSLLFLPRHGAGHRLPPHQINYRANIWALKQMGATQVVAINAVGGITKNMSPQMLVVPHQIIDYSYGREQSFNFLVDGYINHIDFTNPYSETLRQRLLASLQQLNIPHQSQAVYACTQGPRLETAAEIQRLVRDGCDLVGMTAMPEAALARELALDYAALCLVVNWGAGQTQDEISLADIMQNLSLGMNTIKIVLRDFIAATT